MLQVIKAELLDAKEIARCARLAYADECQKRHVENLDPLYPSERCVEGDINKYSYYKVVLDQNIIGGLYVVEKDDTMVIEDFCIEPVHQDKGYGYRVMMALERIHADVNHWHLATPTYSLGNQALYKKLGYIKGEIIQEDGLDLIQFDKYICVSDDKISLEYARLIDREVIYHMLVAPEIYPYMFDDKHPAPSLEAFLEEPASLFTGRAFREGNYLLIKYEGQVIGSISYALNEGKIKSYELDIWISKLDHLGKGIGRQSINMLVDYLVKTYHIKTFLIRPWSKNKQAIKAYKSCGFEEVKTNMKDYYSEADFADYGQGDYGHETVNLVLHVTGS